MVGLDTINKMINPWMNSFANSPVMVFFAMFLMFYAPHMAPTLPAELDWLFESVIVRLIIMFVAAWKMTGNPIMSIIIAVVFLASINILNHKSIFEKFDGPETMIYPGCANITKDMLVESLGGNETKVLEAMKLARVPFSVKLNDYYAPLIATYLIGYGYNINTTCGAPDDSYTGKWKSAPQ